MEDFDNSFRGDNHPVFGINIVGLLKEPGQCSLVGLFLGLGLNFGISLTGWVLAWVILSGIVGWARMKEGSHTPAEIYAGFLAGAGVMTGIMMLV